MLVRLHPIEDARPRPVRGDGRSARRRSCRAFKEAGIRTAVQAGGGPGGGGGGIQFMVQGPQLDQLESYSEALRVKVQAIPGLVDVDTTLNAGKPEMSVYLDRPKASDLGVSAGRRGRGAAPARGRRPGDHLQRRGRAIRSAPPGAGGEPQHAGGPGRPAGAFVAARRRVARQHRHVRERRLSGDDQPHGPPAPGDAHRQPAARALAGHRCRSRLRRRPAS